MKIAALEPTPMTAYGAHKFLRAYLGGVPKSRKTASAGTMIKGKAGRVVTSPQHLIVISFDAGGLRTLEELGFKDVSHYDLEALCNTEEQPAMKGMGRDAPASTPFFDKLCAVLDYLGPRLREAAGKGEVSAVWMSGTAAMARGIQREIRYAFGNLPPDEMSQYRWDKLRTRCSMVMQKAHALPAHVIWETHVVRREMRDEKTGEVTQRDDQMLPGQFATILPSQCEQAVAMTRGIGVPGAPGAPLFNMRPGWSWMETSRAEGRFKAQEPADWSIVTGKMGYPMAESDPSWKP